MTKELWKPIEGYEALYEISSLGRVKRLAHTNVDKKGRVRFYDEKILSAHINRQTGYHCINLSKNGVVKWHSIHRLIADAFIPNPNNLPCINHKDENRANSVLDNLERCTYGYNNTYGSAPDRRRKALSETLIKKGVVLKGVQYGKNLSVTQYSLDGEKIASFEGGCPEIELKLGYKKSSVGSCCRHKNRQAYGFVWRYGDDAFSYEPPTYNKGKVFPNTKPKSHQKYVIKIDEQGDVIGKYKSVSIAAKENGFDRHLFSRTKPVNDVLSIKGMRFIVEKKENEYIPKGHKGARKDLVNKGSIPVCQYSKEGHFMRTFRGAADAARFLGKQNGGADITSCCKKKLKTAYGYIWRYEADERPNAV